VANLPVPVLRTFQSGEVETGAYFNAFRDAVNFVINKPMAFLYQSAGQSVANNTNTAITLDATREDTYGGHSNTTNNSRYTAQVAGTYGIIGHVSWPVNATGVRALELYKNGTVYTSGNQGGPAPVTNWTAQETRITMPLAAGDYVEMFAQQASGGALTLNSGTAPYQTYMSVEWLSN